MRLIGLQDLMVTAPGMLSRLLSWVLEVVEIAKKFTPDLVVLDIGLPIMSGYEVAKALRVDPCFEKTIIVAVSDYGQKEDKKNSKANGFDFHFVKPLDTAILFSTISARLGKTFTSNIETRRTS